MWSLTNKDTTDVRPVGVVLPSNLMAQRKTRCGDGLEHPGRKNLTRALSVHLERKGGRRLHRRVNV